MDQVHAKVSAKNGRTGGRELIGFIVSASLRRGDVAAQASRTSEMYGIGSVANERMGKDPSLMFSRCESSRMPSGAQDRSGAPLDTLRPCPELLR
jgi:hypothetical protein